MKNIAVIGAGFVGLTTAACLAAMKNTVICSDVDKLRVENLKQGILPFYEPGLPNLIMNNMKENRLKFTSDNEVALRGADMIFVCLPTPSSLDGSADTSFIEEFFNSHCKYLPQSAVIVMKSTVPIGYGNRLTRQLQQLNCSYLSNPEFLREGSAVHDFMNPDRIVLGSSSHTACESVKDLYCAIAAPIVETTTSSAELIKYASNGFLSLKISFINEIATLCESAQVDVREVAHGVGLDSRIGTEFLRPGPGWGGSCFPKDTKELLNFAVQNGVGFRTLEAAIEANHAQKRRILNKILAFRESSNFRVGVLGLSFKAGTDDLRDSPAIEIARELIADNVNVTAYDPIAIEQNLAVKHVNFQTVSTWQEAAQNADVLAILTEWKEFSSLDPNELSTMMRQRNIVDARNVLSKKTWTDAGFNFVGVGV